MLVGACLQNGEGSTGGALQAVKCRLLLITGHKVHTVTGTVQWAEGSPLSGSEVALGGLGFFWMLSLYSPSVFKMGMSVCPGPFPHTQTPCPTQVQALLRDRTCRWLQWEGQGMPTWCKRAFLIPVRAFQVSKWELSVKVGPCGGRRGRMWPTSEIIIEYENGLMKSFFKKRMCANTQQLSSRFANSNFPTVLAFRATTSPILVARFLIF